MIEAILAEAFSAVIPLMLIVAFLLMPILLWTLISWLQGAPREEIKELLGLGLIVVAAPFSVGVSLFLLKFLA